MNKPTYYDEMVSYIASLDDVNQRIEEVKKELQEIRTLKSSNRVTFEDQEDISDNYQMNLEWNYALFELADELKCLKYYLHINSVPVRLEQNHTVPQGFYRGIDCDGNAGIFEDYEQSIGE